MGKQVLPGLIDRYLAKTGYQSQQANEPMPRDRPDNLMQPVAKDVGAHGRFDRAGADQFAGVAGSPSHHAAGRPGNLGAIGVTALWLFGRMG